MSWVLESEPEEYYDPSLERRVGLIESGEFANIIRDRPPDAGPVDAPTGIGRSRLPPEPDYWNTELLDRYRAALEEYSRRGLGADWIRRAFYLSTYAPQEQAYGQMRQVRAAQAAQGFTDSGFHRRVLESIDYQRQQAIARAWEAIRTQNEAIKNQAARELADLNEFYKRLRAQGELEDEIFRRNIELQQERWRREQEIAERQLWSTIVRSAFQYGLPILLGGL